MHMMVGFASSPNLALGRETLPLAACFSACMVPLQLLPALTILVGLSPLWMARLTFCVSQLLAFITRLIILSISVDLSSEPAGVIADNNYLNLSDGAVRTISYGHGHCSR